VIRPSEGHLFFEHQLSEAVRDRVLRIVAEEMGVSKYQLESDPSLIEKSGLDSLDLVEIVMEIEDELHGRR
jgi:acyl carrier protein